MASLKKYLFGGPPFAYLANHLAQDEEFLSDANRLINIGQDEYLRLYTAMSKRGGFLGRDALEAIAAEAMEAAGAEKIASFIYRVARILHGADISIDDAVNALASAIAEKKDHFTQDGRRILIERIRGLAVEPAGLARQFKAKELIGATGAELNDFRVICDIRPVFDKKRERIEGAMPITILRLEYSKADGDSDVVEIRITDKQIKSLGDGLSDAKKKNSLLIEMLKKHDVPVPIIGAIDADSDV